MSLSTIEAEYIAIVEVGKKMLWLKKFLQEFKDDYVVFCDNQSAMDLRKNAMYLSCSKHIDVRYHWL